MIDIEGLRRPLSDDSPCGEDLEYDPGFGAMERAAQGKPEQQYGGTVIPAEEPNWAEVRSQGFELLERTRDLRIGVLLARAVLPSGGLVDFNGMLAVIRGWMETFWEPLYPRLDPDDGLDPTIRVNLLTSLCDSSTMLADVKRTPLVSSRMIGRFGLREIAIARGEIPAPESMESPPTTASIDGAFQETPVEQLQATATAIDEAIGNVRGLEAALTTQVGSGNSVSLDPLVTVLRSAAAVLQEQLLKRGVGPISKDDAGDGEGSEAGGESGTATQTIRGEVRSREDVLLALDKICAYYSQREPSSPVPLLIERAKRLVPMTFMEILQDLAPDGVSQAQLIAGIVPE